MDNNFELEAWSRDIFGNIFKQNKRVHFRLEGVHRAMAEHTTLNLLMLESKLKAERSKVLLQEELLWLQKSRID